MGAKQILNLDMDKLWGRIMVYYVSFLIQLITE